MIGDTLLKKMAMIKISIYPFVVCGLINHVLRETHKNRGTKTNRWRTEERVGYTDKDDECWGAREDRKAKEEGIGSLSSVKELSVH